METNFRGARNNKPPSTWKTGISRQPRPDVEAPGKEEVVVPTVDLSKMNQDLGASTKNKGASTRATILK